MKAIIMYTFCCDNLWKSIIRAVENSGDFFLLLCDRPELRYVFREVTGKTVVLDSSCICIAFWDILRLCAQGRKWQR